MKPQESNTDNTNSVQNLPLPKEILVSRGGACAFDSDEDSDSTSSTVVMVSLCIFVQFNKLKCKLFFCRMITLI